MCLYFSFGLTLCILFCGDVGVVLFCGMFRFLLLFSFACIFAGCHMCCTCCFVIVSYLRVVLWLLVCPSKGSFNSWSLVHLLYCLFVFLLACLLACVCLSVCLFVWLVGCCCVVSVLLFLRFWVLDSLWFKRIQDAHLVSQWRNSISCVQLW